MVNSATINNCGGGIEISNIGNIRTLEFNGAAYSYLFCNSTISNNILAFSSLIDINGGANTSGLFNGCTGPRILYIPLITHMINSGVHGFTVIDCKKIEEIYMNSLSTISRTDGYAHFQNLQDTKK